MILHDRVELVQPGGIDRYGYPLPGTTLGIFPADVQPLSTEEKVVYGAEVTVDRNKVVLPPLGVTIGSDWTVRFGGKTWQLDGSAEPYRVNGRVHHIELVMKRAA